MPDKLPFDGVVNEILAEIDKRKGRWVLSTLAFDDVRQIILIRAFNKYHLYDPEKGKFQNWINRVISSAIKNLLRDNLTKTARPCIRCAFNLGGDACSWTPSKRQCIECPWYRHWKDKKESHHNIQAAVSIEGHSQEVNNIQHDFLDIDRAKQIFDEKIPLCLTQQERRMYQLLFVEWKKDEEVGRIMRFNKVPSSPVPGYQLILKFKKKVIALSKRVIEEENLV
jgi:DNA-directed RNA polymerase specialized sigma24 family protein